MANDKEQREDQAQRNAELKALRNLQESDGWQLLKDNLEANLEYLQEAIISKRDPDTGDKLTEQETDQLREKYNAQKELINSPQRLINYLDNRNDRQRFDPYYKDADEIRKARGETPDKAPSN